MTLDDMIDAYVERCIAAEELAALGDVFGQLTTLAIHKRRLLDRMIAKANEERLDTVALCLEIDRRLDKLRN